MGDFQVLLNYGEMVLRVIIASAAGCVIGYERQSRNKEAGIRTHAIVALGAALIMIVSKYGFGDTPDYDTSRVAAQIVSGVGFLGAGIIFVRNNAVSGLTTAAGIWATSGVGMAIGAGLYAVGIPVAFLIVLIQHILHGHFIQKTEHRYAQAEIILKSLAGVQEVEDCLKKQGIETTNIALEREKPGRYKMEVGLILTGKFNKDTLAAILISCNGDCVNSFV